MSATFKPLPTKTVSAKDVLMFRDEAFTEYFTDSNYLKMIEKTFGKAALEDVEYMTKIKIMRKGQNDEFSDN